MDQTKYDIVQSTFQVISELYMPAPSRVVHGEKFTVTLIVEMHNGTTLPLDIYVNRVPLQERGVAYETVDGTKVIVSSASISLEPNADTFDIEFVIERTHVPKEKRPYVRVSLKMFSLILQGQARRGADMVQEIEKYLEA